MHCPEFCKFPVREQRHRCELLPVSDDPLHVPCKNGPRWWCPVCELHQGCSRFVVGVQNLEGSVTGNLNSDRGLPGSFFGGFGQCSFKRANQFLLGVLAPLGGFGFHNRSELFFHFSGGNGRFGFGNFAFFADGIGLVFDGGNQFIGLGAR